MPLLNNTCHSAGLIYTEPIGGNTGWGEKYSGACGLLVGELTVIVKLQLVSRPQLSVAMQVTVVIPMGKVLPLGGLHWTVGGLHPPPAELLKNTVAPLELVAVTVMFVEQCSTIGGLVTVTVKPQLVVVPQLSLAMQVTAVIPMGKVLPLGGLHWTVGGLHPPPAELLKNTVAPLALVANTRIFVEQFSTIGVGLLVAA